MILRIIVDVLIAALSGGIVLVHLALYVGLLRVAVSQQRGFRRSEGQHPTASRASVVVPARNEEENLPALLASLDEQSAKDFQLVLINDRSEDRTQEIMEGYARNAKGRVEIVNLTDSDVNPDINPKQNALAHGTGRCTGDVILFTDSDCVVPPTWVSDVTARYDDPKLGLMIGAITTLDDGGFVPRFHAFDHIFKYGYTAGSVGIGMATGGFGNNLSIRRKALEEVGGFESLGCSTTEDAALIAAVRTRTKWTISAFISERTLVTAVPFERVAEVADQEVRWHIGGLFSDDLNTRLSYGYLMLYLTVSIAALPFVTLLPELWMLPLTSFVTMAAMAVTAGSLTRRRVATYWAWFLPDLIWTMLFNSYLTVRALLIPSVAWKGRTLEGSRRKRGGSSIRNGHPEPDGRVR